MTIQQLQDIPDFFDLFTDQRFVALLNYRREHIGRSPHHQSTHAEGMIYNGAWRDGWLDSLDFTSVATAKLAESAGRSQQKYADPRRPSA